MNQTCKFSDVKSGERFTFSNALYLKIENVYEKSGRIYNCLLLDTNQYGKFHDDTYVALGNFGENCISIGKIRPGKKFLKDGVVYIKTPDTMDYRASDGSLFNAISFTTGSLYYFEKTTLALALG